ncbi:hypothetical protein, partial [Bacillus cereus]|uniref:hypothetical protein n=1 Tax=Bacillus cereus TaxID=1396 RepID=UPI00345BC1A5
MPRLTCHWLYAQAGAVMPHPIGHPRQLPGVQLMARASQKQISDKMSATRSDHELDQPEASQR